MEGEDAALLLIEQYFESSLKDKYKEKKLPTKKKTGTETEEVTGKVFDIFEIAYEGRNFITGENQNLSITKIFEQAENDTKDLFEESHGHKRKVPGSPGTAWKNSPIGTGTYRSDTLKFLGIDQKDSEIARILGSIQIQKDSTELQDLENLLAEAEKEERKEEFLNNRYNNNPLKTNQTRMIELRNQKNENIYGILKASTGFELTKNEDVNEFNGKCKDFVSALNSLYGNKIFSEEDAKKYMKEAGVLIEGFISKYRDYGKNLLQNEGEDKPKSDISKVVPPNGDYDTKKTANLEEGDAHHKKSRGSNLKWYVVGGILTLASVVYGIYKLESRAKDEEHAVGEQPVLLDDTDVAQYPTSTDMETSPFENGKLKDTMLLFKQNPNKLKGLDPAAYNRLVGTQTTKGTIPEKQEPAENRLEKKVENINLTFSKPEGSYTPNADSVDVTKRPYENLTAENKEPDTTMVAKPSVSTKKMTKVDAVSKAYEASRRNSSATEVQHEKKTIVNDGNILPLYMADYSIENIADSIKITAKSNSRLYKGQETTFNVNVYDNEGNRHTIAKRAVVGDEAVFYIPREGVSSVRVTEHKRDEESGKITQSYTIDKRSIDEIVSSGSNTAAANNPSAPDKYNNLNGSEVKDIVNYYNTASSYERARMSDGLMAIVNQQRENAEKVTYSARLTDGDPELMQRMAEIYAFSDSTESMMRDMKKILGIENITYSNVLDKMHRLNVEKWISMKQDDEGVFTEARLNKKVFQNYLLENKTFDDVNTGDA